MDNNAFWAFFTVAIIAGFAIGMVFTGTGITGQFTQAVSTPAVEAPTFGETDGGLDYTTPGTCTDSTGIHTDFCANAGTVLEYVFNEENQMCSAVAYNCILGGFKKCEAGACTNGWPKGEKVTTIVAVEPAVGTIAVEEPVEAIGGGGAATTGTAGEQPTTGAIGGGVFHETSTSQSVRSSLKSTRTSFFRQTGFFFTFGEEVFFMSSDGKVLWVLTTISNAATTTSGRGVSFECTGTFIQTSFGAVCQGGNPFVGEKMLGEYGTPST